MPHAVKVPAASTVHAVLDRHGLVKRMARPCAGDLLRTPLLARKKISLSKSLAGKAVSVKEVEDDIWLVSFMDYNLGYVNLEEGALQPLENSFGQKFHLCLRNELLPMCPEWINGDWGG